VKQSTRRQKKEFKTEKGGKERKKELKRDKNSAKHKAHANFDKHTYLFCDTHTIFIYRNLTHIKTHRSSEGLNAISTTIL